MEPIGAASPQDHEGLLRNQEQQDQKLDDIWTEEAENRLKAYRKGRLEAIPMELIFKDET